MAKREKIDTRGGPALTHNPFAALSAKAPSRAEPEQPAALTPIAPHASPFAPKVVARRETKGRGGKTITRVSGVAAAHREAVAGRLKKALGCGAIVEGEDVILLGSLVERAAEWLEREGAPRVVRAN
jgi:translation initiation factor 1